MKKMIEYDLTVILTILVSLSLTFVLVLVVANLWKK